MTDQIAQHYAGGAELTTTIAQALRAAGKDLDKLTTGDLATVDEFHIRGRVATLELAETMGLTPQTHVLDIGSGLGGPARTVAEVYGATVTGIDLTPSFCEVAAAMSEWTGLAARTAFQVADATSLPFAAESFDVAITLHVAMNIPDKAAVYAETRRVLRPGGLFGIYDVMQGEGGEIRYPVPWARDRSISHVATPEQMRALLLEAGFELLEEVDSSAASVAWFRDMAARMAADGPPPVSFRDFLGEEFPTMAANMVTNLSEGRVRTVRMLCRA